MNTDLPYIIALTFQKGIGDILAKKIIHFFGSAETAWKAKPQNLIDITGVGKQLIKDFGNENYLVFAYKEIEYCNKNEAVSKER